MITITKAKEDRTRDIKRKRLILTIGDKQYHITRDEAAKLVKQIIKTGGTDGTR